MHRRWCMWTLSPRQQCKAANCTW
ncbi:unnamed protein product [Ectocarpus sp. CCAP 1310/34]|nr:unnamed protein product [Ectocarpus sp. CCAP 1310/34]